jgi:hypothetical protein
LAVFLPGEERLWSSAICERLAEENAAVYDGWDQNTLQAALKPYDVETKLFWGQLPDDETRKGTSRMGVYREAVLDAMARRHNP